MSTATTGVTATSGRLDRNTRDSRIVNPLGAPLRATLRASVKQQITLPYIHVIITFVVFIAIAVLLVAMYLTLGIANIVMTALWRQIGGLRRQAADAGVVETAGYMLAVGLLFVVSLPFFAAQLPLMLMSLLGQLFIR